MNDRLKRAKEALRLKKHKNLENMEKINRGRGFFRKQKYVLADENQEKEVEARSLIVEVVDDAESVKSEYLQPQHFGQETFFTDDSPYFLSNERVFSEQKMTMMTSGHLENSMRYSEIPNDLDFANNNLMVPSTSNGYASATLPAHSPSVSQLLRRPNVVDIMRRPTTFRRARRPQPATVSDPPLYTIAGGLVVSDVELFQQVDRLQRLVAHKDRVIRDLKRRIVGMEQHNNQLARIIFARKKQQKTAESVNPAIGIGSGEIGNDDSKTGAVKNDDECDDGIIDVSA